jgi:hypothetical protein
MSIVKGIPAYLINRDKRKNTPYFFTVDGAYFLDEGERLGKAGILCKISRNSWQKKLQRGESR